MTDLEGLLPARVGKPEILAAARQIFDQGWRAGDSAFSPGTWAWSPDNANALHEAFVGHPDTSSGGFIDKLAGQLKNSSDAVKLLAAEMIALLMLPLADWKPATKRERRRSPTASPTPTCTRCSRTAPLCVCRLVT